MISKLSREIALLLESKDIDETIKEFLEDYNPNWCEVDPIEYNIIEDLWEERL